LTASNRTASIDADSAVVAASYEEAACGNDILKRISTVSADLQHTSVEAEVRIGL